MHGLDEIRTRESGDRPCNARHTDTAAAGERQPFDGARQEPGSGVGSSRQSSREPATGSDDALAYERGALARGSRELDTARSWHRDREIETVQKRTGELLAIRGKPLCRAPTLDSRISSRATGAHVHRAHELEIGREDRVPAGTDDRDHSILERLSQRLQHRARELGKLVEQQDTVMCECSRMFLELTWSATDACQRDVDESRPGAAGGVLRGSAVEPRLPRRRG